jgi:D-lactate dehydrogenase (cytochrome)
MVGTEGALGLVMEASLKLTSRPENISVAVTAFPSNHDAFKVVQEYMPVVAMELLDATTVKVAKEGKYCDKEYPETPQLFSFLNSPAPEARSGVA